MRKTVDLICTQLRARIAEGEFNDNRRLPSERTLSQQFDTTRITLREALATLENQGLIYRELRRGWFIAPPRLIYDPLHHSHFSAMAQAQGLKARTELIEAGLVSASARLVQQLQLAMGDQVIRIRRRRRIEGRAVLYVENYLNPSYFPGLLNLDLSQALTDLYQSRYDLHYGGVQLSVLPEPLPEQASTMLHVASGSPGVFITRVNRDQHDRIIDCDYEYWRYDALYIDVQVDLS